MRWCVGMGDGMLSLAKSLENSTEALAGKKNLRGYLPLLNIIRCGGFARIY